jgi:acylphosphatase
VGKTTAGDIHIMVTLRASVYGRVQNVGFRMFVRDAARRMGLRGYVRNVEDGSVYVLAVGPRATLDELLRHLYRGPAGARVSEVHQEWSEGEPDGLASTFEVRH